MKALVLTEKDYIKLIKNRDPRFDGRFYFGVKTTRIYCRPICPARPKPENIIIFKGQSEAQLAGYRACKRCRPDFSHISRLIEDKSNFVSHIQDYIEANLSDVSIESICSEFSLSDRHLRRIFNDFLGVNPTDVINSFRASLAKKFILNSNNTITDIALSVGFNSLRNFNRVFKDLYQQTPSSLRESGKKGTLKSISIEHNVIGDFDWTYILEFLNRHCITGQEVITDKTYTRYFVNKDISIGYVLVDYKKKKKTLQFSFFNLDLQQISRLYARLKFLFDLNHNPEFLPSKNKKYKGIRVPTSFSPFEVSISIIIGQLVSTEQATRSLNKLISEYGLTFKSELFDVTLFPSPDKLIKEPLEGFGLTKQKMHSIKELSKLYLSNTELFYNISLMDKLKEELKAIKGIGPWTISLICMRCLGDIDSYPKSDLIIRRAIDLGIFNESKWAGYRGYLTHLIWRDYAHKLTKKKESK